MDKRIEKLLADLCKELDENCQHVFKQVGLWDGQDKEGKSTFGPTCRCIKCGGRINLKWPDWDNLPKESKIEKPSYR